MNGVPAKPCLRFGIPSLDDLFGNFSLSHRSYGVPLEKDEQTKLAIIGPEGSGKSILAFHLASRYAADAWCRASRSSAATARKMPKVVYLSTDLTITKAQTMWQAFQLNRPNIRQVPFYRSTVRLEDAYEVPAPQLGLEARLVEILPLSEPEPANPKTLAEFLLDDSEEQVVDIGFIDLITHPVGDIWSLCTRLLASLDRVEDAPDQHLLLIDNVDGCEVIVGELNAFGDRSSVRARIMQSVQAARRKAHLVFVAEQQGPGSRPLSDVSDVVVRLSIQEEAGYRSRVVEIQKARAQAIHRGDHHFLVRTGNGSTTGLQENPDDPLCTNAYVQVIPSLSTNSRRVMNEPTELHTVEGLIHSRRAGFGLPNLDELCGSSANTPGNTPPFRADRQGLPFGTLTAILGESNTYKTPLGYHFLLRGFELFAEEIARLYRGSTVGGSPFNPREIRNALRIIQEARDARYQGKRQDSDPNPGSSDTKEDPTGFFDQAQKANFLVRVLVRSEIGEESMPTPQTVHDECRTLNGQGPLPPGIALSLAHWIKQILSARLLDASHNRLRIEEFVALANATLSEAHLAAGGVFQRFISQTDPTGSPAAEITGKDLVDAAADYWKRRYRSFIRSSYLSDGFQVEEMLDVEEYFARFDEYMSGTRYSKAQLARNAADLLREKYEPAKLERRLNQAAGKKKQTWSAESAFHFLQARFPGTVSVLESDLRRSLQSKSIGSYGPLPQDLVFRLFVNLAHEGVATKLQKARTDRKELNEWLSRVPGLKPLRGSGVTLDLLCKCIWKCVQDFGAPSERNFVAAQTRAIRTLPSVGQPTATFVPANRIEGRRSDLTDESWSGLIKEIRSVAPEIVVPSDFRSATIDPESPKRFAGWIFGISPKTHPYVHKTGLKQLEVEIRSMMRTDTTEIKAPVFCAAAVALVLELVRTGKLERDSKAHLEEEMTHRRRATETPKLVRDWIESVFPKEDRTEGVNPAASQCLRTLKLFLQKASDRQLADGDFADLVESVSELKGVLVRPDQFDNPDPITAARMKLRVCRMVLEAAAREGLVDGPAVLVTTNDMRFEVLRYHFDVWLREFCARQPHDRQTNDLIAEVALDHLRDWLLVRRLEVHYLATATLAHIVRRCVESAQATLFEGLNSGEDSDSWEYKVNQRRSLSWNVRLVIDGLTALRQTHPNIESDPLFLPALRFYIGRENLTGIVIISQSGAPDALGGDEFERSSLDIFLKQIRTWRVHFFGELRVAATCLPPSPEFGTAKIRELFPISAHRLDVCSQFELYKGLERGRPERVPLEIRLIGDTRALQDYQASLNAVLTDVFPAIVEDANGINQVVLSGSGGIWAEKLRDFARLHSDTRLGHSLILQMDEYWAVRRSGALRNQWRYLSMPCDRPDNDPLGVFRPTHKDHGVERLHRRYGHFDWQGFDTREREPSPAEQKAVDRIPFLWDFGFLLCKQEAWEAARDQEFTANGRKWRVEDVWQSTVRIAEGRLRSANPARGSGDPGVGESRSWRVFLEAAAVTAAHHSLGTGSNAAFDLPVRGGESLACLILEMWASEVYRKFGRKGRSTAEIRTLFGPFTSRSWLPSGTRGLIGLIAEPESERNLKGLFGRALAAGKLPHLNRHSLDLFKSLLLLREVFDLSSFLEPGDSFRLKSRPVNPDAVCARHWYGTACDFFDVTQNPERFVPVRLPGHFSVRGDWFLTVARGSHSDLLADRALDLLSSRRGNYERLRQGLGLPVRHVSDPENGGDPRTRLTTVDQHGRKSWISYSKLAGLGSNPEGEFDWLWRSSLGDYDAQAHAFHQGIILFLNWWCSLRNVRGTGWKSGFQLYDALERYETLDENDEKDKKEKERIFRDDFAVNSLWEFPELCDDIIDRLKRATPRD